MLGRLLGYVLLQVLSALKVDSEQTFALGGHDLRYGVLVNVNARLLLLHVLLSRFSLSVLLTILEPLLVDGFTSHLLVLTLLLFDDILEILKVQLGVDELRLRVQAIVKLLLGSRLDEVQV